MTDRHWHEIVYAYFCALMTGYADPGQSKPLKTTITELPGSKMLTYQDKGLTVIDYWQITPHSDYSFGTITISDDKGVIWVMQYWGRYDEQVISFLKEALRQTCIKGKFVGGRGPHSFTKGELTYTNMVANEGDSANFSGREEIHDERGKLLGWHEYHGMKTW